MLPRPLLLEMMQRLAGTVGGRKRRNIVRKLSFAVIVAALAFAVPALAEEWKNVPLVDKMCLAKVKANTDKHPTSCLIECADSGYGILIADGTWLKLDKAGNDQALAALKATDKKNHIRVDVTGERTGDTIKVTALTIP